MKAKTDLFTNIHHTLRTLLGDAAQNLQLADFSDEKDAAAALRQLNPVFDLIQDHACIEDNLIFPVIARAQPGVTGKAEAEHQEYERQQQELDRLMDKIRQAYGPAERVRLGLELNQAFGRFVTFKMHHMQIEEETVLPATLECLSQEELDAIREEILDSVPPYRYGPRERKFSRR